MCFIKTIYRPPSSNKMNFDTFYNPKEQCFHNFLKKKNYSQHQENPKNPHLPTLNHNQQKLFAFFSAYMTINQNSINTISKKISSCEEKLNELLFLSAEPIKVKQKDHKSSGNDHSHQDFGLNEIETSQNKEQFSQNPLTNKLFGGKKYKYKLSLAENDFQTVIYKERNLKLNIALRDIDGKIVRNCNIMNLCLAFADDNGKWITWNRVGDPMLKGKTQVELYHGEAEFNKIYAKDISRTFANGRLNFVVYAKPSMLIYNGVANGIEERVQVSAIEPLVLQGIIIKAKKKY